jgi:hypothetical protein
VATAHGFYRLMRGRCRRRRCRAIPAISACFRRVRWRRCAQLRERHRFMKGLFGWVGFNQVAIARTSASRASGRAQQVQFLEALWNFALEGITSFSTAPLRMATYLGVATALVAAFVYGSCGSSLKALLWGDPVAGWPTMMAVILFLGGVQLVALGLIGEYLGPPVRGIQAAAACTWSMSWLSRDRSILVTGSLDPDKERAMRTVRQLLESKSAEVHLDPAGCAGDRRDPVDGRAPCIGALLVMEGASAGRHPVRARLRAEGRAAGALLEGHASARHHDRGRSSPWPRSDSAPSTACRW